VTDQKKGATNPSGFIAFVDERYRLNGEEYERESARLWHASVVLQQHAQKYGNAHGTEVEQLDRHCAFIASMLRAMSIECLLLAKYYLRERQRHNGDYTKYTEWSCNHDLVCLASAVGIALSESQSRQLNRCRDMLTLGRFTSKKFAGGRKITKTALAPHETRLRNYLRDAPVTT